MIREIRIDGENAMREFAERLVDALVDPAGQNKEATPAIVVFLQGDLGAGKSFLARAMLRRLGVKGTVRSPTYTLLESYESRFGRLSHLDLYRLDDPEELHYLDIGEVLASSRLSLIEWAEYGDPVLGAPDLRVEIRILGDDLRQLRLSGPELSRLNDI